MSTAVLVAPPPITTSFLDKAGRISAPWVAWLASITTAAAALSSGAATGALLAINNLSDLVSLPAARSNLGLGTAATHDTTYFDLAGAAAAVLATSLQMAQNLADLSNVVTARNNLGLGSAATQPSSAFDPAGAGSAAVSAIPTASSSVRGLLASADWSTFNGKQPALGFTPLNPANNLSEVTASTARSNLGLGTAATHASGDFDASGAAAAAVAGIPNASATATGLLASADWSTFNAKQAALGYVPLNAASNLSDLASVSTARTNLGLAASATIDATNANNISSGTLPAGRLPTPSASTLGGVQSIAAVTSKFLTSISTAGVPAAAQPAFSDISGTIATGQVPTLNQNTTGTAANVTGTVAIANGGTGSTTASAALTALGAAGTATANSFTANQVFKSGGSIPFQITDSTAALLYFTVNNASSGASIVLAGGTNSGHFNFINLTGVIHPGLDIYPYGGGSTPSISLRASGSGTGSGPCYFNAGNTLFGTATDNGVDKVQVSGTLTAAGLKSTGCLTTAVSIKTAAYTVTTSDRTIEADATTAGFTVTLPASPVTGQEVWIIKIDATANVVTIGGTVNGVASKTLTTQWQSIKLQYNGSAWRAY